MKTLLDYINEERYDELAHELKVGDWIEFDTTGVTVFGEISDIDDNEKITIITAGWRGDKDFKPKDSYSIGSKRKCFKLNVTDKTREAFHKWIDSK